MALELVRVLEEFRGRIVDFHAHIGCDQRFILRCDLNELLSCMDWHGIKIAVVSSTLSLVYDYRAGNAHVAEAVAKSGGRVLGLIAANPLYGEECLNELRKYASIEGFIGVKFHPDYFHIQPSHKLAEPLWSEVAKMKLIAAIHSYDGGVEVAKLADMYPDLTIVMYHMGGAKWREGIERVKRFDNIYAEISSSIVDVGIIEKAVEVLGAERILYGSDMPYLDPTVSFGKLLGAGLSKRELELILVENGLKLLKRWLK